MLWKNIVSYDLVSDRNSGLPEFRSGFDRNLAVPDRVLPERQNLPEPEFSYFWKNPEFWRKKSEKSPPPSGPVLRTSPQESGPVPSTGDLLVPREYKLSQSQRRCVTWLPFDQWQRWTVNHVTCRYQPPLAKLSQGTCNHLTHQTCTGLLPPPAN